MEIDPRNEQKFSILERVQTGSMPHPASYPKGIGKEVVKA
jgi:hypothetical protein